MEISLILTNDTGQLEVQLGSFIATAVAETQADRILAQQAAESASGSAEAASTSQTSAASSAAAASTSASNAATSESNAATSATNAGASATAAQLSATNAAASASAASTSASNASGSETSAASSAAAAANSAAAAAASVSSSLAKSANLSDVPDIVAARAALGTPGLTTSNVFTGAPQQVNSDYASIILNNTSTVTGSYAYLAFWQAGARRGQLYRTNDDQLVYSRYDSSSAFVDSPLTIDSTGALVLNKALSQAYGGTGQVSFGTAKQKLVSQGAGNPMAWADDADLSQVSLIYGLRGSTSNDTKFSTAPTSVSSTSRLRLKFTSAILKRGATNLAPITIKNFDAELNIATTGPGGMDVALGAGAAVVRAFIVFDDSGNSAICGSTSSSPSLTGTLSSYLYAWPLAIHDVSGTSWTSDMKMVGQRMIYKELRTLSSNAITSGSVQSVSFFNNDRDLIRDIDLELFVSLTSTAYGEGFVSLSSLSYVAGDTTGLAMRLRNIMYCPSNYASGGATDYKNARALISPPGDSNSWKVFGSGGSGSIAAWNYTLNCYGYLINNGAVN